MIKRKDLRDGSCFRYIDTRAETPTKTCIVVAPKKPVDLPKGWGHSTGLSDSYVTEHRGEWDVIILDHYSYRPEGVPAKFVGVDADKIPRGVRSAWYPIFNDPVHVMGLVTKDLTDLANKCARKLIWTNEYHDNGLAIVYQEDLDAKAFPTDSVVRVSVTKPRHEDQANVNGLSFTEILYRYEKAMQKELIRKRHDGLRHVPPSLTIEFALDTAQFSAAQLMWSKKLNEKQAEVVRADREQVLVDPLDYEE